MVRRRLVKQEAQKLIAKFPQCVNDRTIDPVALATRLGIEVRAANIADNISGFLVFDAQGKPFIGVNSSHHTHRQRFTVAHEIGHYLLHERTKPHMDDENGAFNVRLRSDLSSTGSDPREVEANLFAAELLMPSEWLENDIRGHAHIDVFENSLISELATRYSVSEHAITIRLTRLGYIDEA